MMQTILKRILIGVSFCLCILTVHAQEDERPAKPREYYRWELGIHLMPVFSSFSMATSSGVQVEEKQILGYGFGLVKGINFNPNLGARLEIIYTTFSHQYFAEGKTKNMHVNYANVPIMASINTDRRRKINVNLVLGPQIGINAGSSIENADGSSDTLQSTWNVNHGRLGVAYGAGIEMKVGNSEHFRIDVGFRGTTGFMEIADNSTPSTRSYNQNYVVRLHTHALYSGVIWLF
jgi:hypothetical protein